MGIAKKSDGRYVVGKGISDSNDYNGSMGYRDIVIQLTESGATAKSVKKLEFLRDYATYHAGLREPIVPPNVQIWISGNGYSKAVEADDINITDNGFEICGIVYNGSSWDYTNAGKSSGGSGLPEVSAADNGKLLGVTDGAWGKVDAPSGGGTEIFNVVFTGSLDDQNDFIITSSKTAAEILAAQQAGKYITANYMMSDFDEGTRAIAVNVYEDYNSSPYCSVIFLMLFADGSQATSSDAMEFLKIYWDSTLNVWTPRTYFYTLTPESP